MVMSVLPGVLLRMVVMMPLMMGVRLQWKPVAVLVVSTMVGMMMVVHVLLRLQWMVVVLLLQLMVEELWWKAPA